MRRKDGRKLKTIGPFVKLIPYIMTKRSDAQIFTKQLLDIEPIETYLRLKRSEGHDLSLLHFFIAVYVRVIAQRPQINRFVMNGKLYARDAIYISMAVKRSLRDEGEETTVKFRFTGHESIFDIAKMVDEQIEKALKDSENNDTDQVANVLMSMPGKKALIELLKWMDRHNLLPRAIIDASPFHTSLFVTYLKSIKLDYIYHHLYDFGTTGIFVAVGIFKKQPIVEKDQVIVRNCCELGYVLDERICDGFYFSNSLRMVKKYLGHPELLEERLEEVLEDVR